MKRRDILKKVAASMAMFFLAVASFPQIVSAEEGDVAGANIEVSDGLTSAEDSCRKIRPDGNYVYNGSFDQEAGGLGYWEIPDEDMDYIRVTNKNFHQELEVVIPDNRTVKIAQTKLNPLVASEYELSFSAKCLDGAKSEGMTILVAGVEYVPTLFGSNAKFARKFSFSDEVNIEDSDLIIRFRGPGRYCLDNVILKESANIKKVSFLPECLASYPTLLTR